jgi:hypothetical protein
VRLRWHERSEDGKNQSNNGCHSPAHLVVPKQPNIDVIHNEIQWHTQYEQNDKTAHSVGHAGHGFAEDEGESHEDCATRDN